MKGGGAGMANRIDTAGVGVRPESRMGRRTGRIPAVRPTRLAWSLWLLAAALVVGGSALSYLNRSTMDSNTAVFYAFSFAGAMGFATIGSVVAVRHQRNPIGWLFLLTAIGFAGVPFAEEYAVRGLVTARGSLPGVAWIAFPSDYLWTASIGLIILAFLLFPDGRAVSPRWRIVVRLTGLLLALYLLAEVFGPITTTGNNNRLLTLRATVANPLGIHALKVAADVVLAIAQLGLVVSLVAAVISLAKRRRRSTGDERQQLRWLGFVGAVAATSPLLMIGYAVGLPVFGIAFWAVFAGLLSLGIPIASGIAILKYRLYDIDIVISRTLVYGTLAVLITVVYVGIAVGIGSVVGSGGKPNLGLSILATAIVAVGFQPVRERLQKVANRLVYGKRATPYEVLSQFSERVAESYASDDVLPRMARVLAEGTNADLAEVWLRSGDALQRAATFPLQPSVPTAVHVNGAAELVIPAADRSVVVRNQGEVLGALTVTKRRGESITPIEIKLMDDLAHQAGLVLKNVSLTADLQARLVDLRASRERLVAAQDDERRRLERNLHDGAQQHLVALKVKLGLAEMLATRDLEKARAAVAELKHDADEALETLRDLARGIYPPLLADKGLVTALHAQARKATLPVTVEADGIGRYPQDTEAALYFCILEALQNMQKYAQASRAVVHLHEDGDRLSVEVVDDGRGFDVGTTIRGNGLTNMEDRLEALGGTLQIASSPGNGTTLRAAIPVTRAMVAAAGLLGHSPANGDPTRCT
jgi:signal transduction histidine kinase